MKRTNLLLGALLLWGACKDEIQGGLSAVPGHDSLAQDNSHKEAPRLMAAESYIRSYLRIFGGPTATALQTQTQLSGDALFDSFSTYLSALGLPSYATDLPRATQTNALMVTTFERMGVALCDRALLRDWSTTTKVAVAQRTVYAFDPPADPTDKVAFAAGLDVLHRTFLGYPVAMAPTNRVDTYFDLFKQVSAAHDPVKTPKLTANQAAWAAMCYGLIRHPEFQLY